MDAEALGLAWDDPRADELEAFTSIYPEAQVAVMTEAEGGGRPSVRVALGDGETEEKQVTAETAFYKFLGYGGVSSEFLSDHGFPQLELRLPIGIQQRQNDFLTG